MQEAWINSCTSESLQAPWISDNSGLSSLLIALVGERAKGSLSALEKALMLSLCLCQQHCLMQEEAGGSFFITSLCMDCGFW